MSQYVRLEQLVVDLSERITQLENTVASLNKVIFNYHYDEELKEWSDNIVQKQIIVDGHLIKTGKLAETVDVTLVFVDPYVDNTIISKLPDKHANKIFIIIVDHINTSWISQYWIKSVEKLTMQKLLGGDDKIRERDEPPSQMNDEYIEKVHDMCVREKMNLFENFGYNVLIHDSEETLLVSLWKEILPFL